MYITGSPGPEHMGGHAGIQIILRDRQDDPDSLRLPYHTECILTPGVGTKPGQSLRRWPGIVPTPGV